MQEFTRSIERIVTVKSNDKAIPDATFILKLGPGGLIVRRHGESERVGHLTWRSIIGHMLIHKERRQ